MWKRFSLAIFILITYPIYSYLNDALVNLSTVIPVVLAIFISLLLSTSLSIVNANLCSEYKTSVLVANILMLITMLVGAAKSALHPDTTLPLFSIAVGRTVFIAFVLYFLFVFLALTTQRIVAQLGGLTVSQLINRSAIGLIFLAMLLAIAYWSASNSHFVYFWDFRNYWKMTETLCGYLVQNDWIRFFGDIYYNLSSDYSRLPAIFPALSCTAFGSVSRVSYLLAITTLYAFPAFVVTVLLANKILGNSVTTGFSRKPYKVFLGLLGVLLLTPHFFTTALYLRPDIGGVVISAVAILFAHALYDQFRTITDTSDTRPNISEIVYLGIGLAIALSLTLLFRRWYSFFGLGLIAALLSLVVFQLIRRPRNLIAHTRLFAQLTTILLGVAVSFLILVFVDWSKNLGQHDYAHTYSSYKFPVETVISRFLSNFGVLILGITLLLPFALKNFRTNWTFLYMLYASSVLAWLLFNAVQTSGIHHYLLLMPLLGSVLAAAIFKGLEQKPGITIFAMTLAVLASIWETNVQSEDAVSKFVLPSYKNWLPKQQPHLDGYQEIISWLNLPQNAHKTFCVVASSGAINQGIFDEIWQIFPRMVTPAFQMRQIHLNQVDSSQGPPNSEIKDCNIALLGIPFQTHLPQMQQYDLQIVFNDIFSGNGIGAAFRREPKRFRMSDEVSVLAYQRVFESSQESYSELVYRYNLAKELAP